MFIPSRVVDSPGIVTHMDKAVRMKGMMGRL